MSHIASGAPGDLTAPSRTAEDHAALAGALIPPPAPAWRRLARRLLHLWLLVLFLVVWETVSTLGVRINPQLDVMLPPPTAVFSAAQELMARGVLLTHIADSLRRVLVAVGVGAILGVPLGLAMGWSAGFRASVEDEIGG